VLLAQDEATAPKTPTYILDPEPDDEPARIRLKAALRLFSAYRQVQIICEKCGQPQVMKGFHSANGSVLNKISLVFREAGGLQNEWKEAVEIYTDKAVQEATSASDCPELMELIRDNHWTLYEGRFSDDYKIVRGK
jgi:hypothetical protein